MKRIYLLLSLLITAYSCFAQKTNIFPDTGKAGIGTTSPLTNLHVIGSGTNINGDNAHHTIGGGIIIQGNTGSRSDTTGAQLEFALPASTDGSNMWGQGRIITVAGNNLNSSATGKMIIGTRRSFDKLGTGAQWYYGNDLVIDGRGNIGIGTTSPTHSLTLNSNASGIAYYNTADQTTSYERAVGDWASNVFQLRTEAGGTGTTRGIAMGIGATLIRSFTITNTGSPSGIIRIDEGNLSSAGASGLGIFGTLSAATGTQAGTAIVPTVLQTGPSGYRALWISPFESTTGTGIKYLIDAGTNTAANPTGTHTSMFRIDNTGGGYFAGNVGIGTAQPTSAAAYRTEIYGSGLQLGLSGSVNGAGQTVGLEFNQQTTVAGTRQGGAIKSVATGTYTGGAGSTYNSDLVFYAAASGTNTERMRIFSNGSVGIGAPNTYSYKLAVNGSAIATEMWVKQVSDWSDFVFSKDYHLPALTDLKTYIDKNHHLPDVPTEKEVKQNGQNLGEMNKILLQKVEELTLYMIELNRQVKEQQKKIERLEAKQEK